MGRTEAGPDLEKDCGQSPPLSIVHRAGDPAAPSPPRFRLRLLPRAQNHDPVGFPRPSPRHEPRRSGYELDPLALKLISNDFRFTHFYLRRGPGNEGERDICRGWRGLFPSPPAPAPASLTGTGVTASRQKE